MPSPFICGDCGEEIEKPFHACLAPDIAAQFVYELREINSIKNARIETLEDSLEAIKRLMEETHGENARFHFPYGIVCDALLK